MPIERRLLETGSHRVPVELARLQGPPLTNNRPASTVADCVLRTSFGSNVADWKSLWRWSVRVRCKAWRIGFYPHYLVHTEYEYMLFGRSLGPSVARGARRKPPSAQGKGRSFGPSGPSLSGLVPLTRGPTRVPTRYLQAASPSSIPYPATSYPYSHTPYSLLIGLYFHKPWLFNSLQYEAHPICFQL